MTTTTFTVGKTYKVKGSSITITRRTEKSVWFLGWDGVETRRKVETMGNKIDIDGMYEAIRYDDLSIVRACDVVVNETEVTEVIETETTTDVNETEVTEVIETVTDVNETETLTANERRAMIDSFNHCATQLNTAEYGSPKWDSIWDKMQELKKALDQG